MELETLVAKIERYVFHNKDNSYSIVRVLSKEDINYTIVGYLPILSEDVYYEFYGNWITHDRYGQQFQITSYKKSEAQSEEGLISYLSSSLFTGIGPVTAKKIVEELGPNAIKIILEDKNVLRKFGLNNLRTERFYQQLIDNQTNESILIDLYSFNISGKTAMKILNAYGVLTIEKLKENPYRLINEIDGIGFIKADEIAHKLGIEDDDPRRIKASIIHAISSYTNSNGDVYLNKEQLFREVNSLLNFEFDLSSYLYDLISEGAIILEDDRYYLFNNYQTEINLANQIKRINKTFDKEIDLTFINTLIETVQIQKNIEYTEKQKEAILQSISNKLSIITGGPGTGKTTIIDGIIEVYAIYHNLKLNALDIDEKIALMAPTGRAAKRMEQVLDLPAKTIHRHLGYGFDGIFKYNAKNQMPYDLIIIDESSMIDLYLADRLFSAIKTEAQVIIVGDVDQLPSVGPGQILKDLIDSKVIKTAYLNEIHRQAKNSNIIKLAYAVNNQIVEDSDLNSGNDLYLRKAYQNQIANIILNQVQGAINQGFNIIDDIQVLIPTYKGEIGIDNINAILQENFSQTKDKSITYGNKVYYENDKVIQLVNNPENFVMNGDIGYIKTIGKTKDGRDFLVIDFDGNEVAYEKGDLDNINLAYAMSIHKSQGSEYKIVILPLVKNYIHMLKKELLYTAITRAKDFLIILGDMQLLIYAANHLADQRQTTLKHRLEK